MSELFYSNNFWLILAVAVGFGLKVYTSIKKIKKYNQMNKQ